MFANDSGFESLHEYIEQWVKQKGFKSIHEYHEHLAKEKGFASYSEYNEYIEQKKLCESLQKITSDVEDPGSIFNDIEFIRKITGCKVPTKKTQIF